MFKHIEKKRKRAALAAPSAGGDFLSREASSSESSSESSNEGGSQEGSDDGGCDEDMKDLHSDDEEEDGEADDSDGELPKTRVPKSLWVALDRPVLPMGGADMDKEEEPSDSDASINDDASSAAEDSGEGQTEGSFHCLMCPLKKLKNPEGVQEHLASKAHARRVKRYRDYITSPPVNTLLSPDPLDIVAILDTAQEPSRWGRKEAKTAQKGSKRRQRKSQGQKGRAKVEGGMVKVAKTAKVVDSAAEKGTAYGENEKVADRRRRDGPRIRKGKRERKQLAEARAAAKVGKAKEGVAPVGESTSAEKQPKSGSVAKPDLSCEQAKASKKTKRRKID